MSFVATYDDAREFFYLIDMLGTILEELPLLLRQDGIFTRTVDPSRVYLVELELPSGAFEEYSFNADSDIKVGLDLSELKKMLRQVKKGSRLRMVYEETLKLQIVGRFSKTLKAPLSAAVLEIIDKKVAVNYVCRAKIAIDALRDAMKDIEAIGERVTFTGTKEGLKITSTSDRGDYECFIEAGSEYMLEHEVEQEASVTVAAEELSKFVSKAYRVCDFVEVAVPEKGPLKLRFELPKGGAVTLYVAPMLE